MTPATHLARRAAQLAPVVKAFQAAGLALPGIEAKAWVEKTSEESSSLDAAQVSGAAQ
jgi:hypothetical protein